MHIVKEGDKTIVKLLKVSRIRPSVYRLMDYVITEKIDDGCLLQNAITGELIFLDREETEIISALPCSHAPWMDELIKKNFLCKEGSDDKKTVDALRFALKMLKTSKNITGYTILPTTNCNARCFYCYQTRCQHEEMSDETADRLVEFMVAHHGDQKLKLRWFGGEPLMGIRQIDRISKALTEKNIPFSANMISNGYLFDAETAKRAKETWRLKKIQITLDGTEKIYNQTKAYIHPCESPYQKVIQNIGYLMENDIKVSIRLNLGLHNADDLNALVLELAERFEDKTNLSAYSHLLFNHCRVKPVHFNPENLALLKAKKEALDELIRSFSPVPYKGSLPKLKVNRCIADSPSSITVLPSGKFGKCEHYLDQYFIGSLETGMTEIQQIKNFEEPLILPECWKCPMYPACIKLKLCEPNQTCMDMADQLSAKEVKRSMKGYYEAWLQGKDISFLNP